MEIDKLLEHGEAFAEGLKKGQELAIGKYNKMFVELWDKLNDVEKKIDKLFLILSKFAKGGSSKG